MSDPGRARRSGSGLGATSGGRANRISVTLRDGTLDELQLLAEQQGRSLSNLCARLIEGALQNGIRPD